MRGGAAVALQSTACSWACLACVSRLWTDGKLLLGKGPHPNGSTTIAGSPTLSTYCPRNKQHYAGKYSRRHRAPSEEHGRLCARHRARALGRAARLQRARPLQRAALERAALGLRGGRRAQVRRRDGPAFGEVQVLLQRKLHLHAPAPPNFWLAYSGLGARERLMHAVGHSACVRSQEYGGCCPRKPCPAHLLPWRGH